MVAKITLCLILVSTFMSEAMAEQVRARDLGIKPGILKTGAHNAITDVAGVLVVIGNGFGK